MFGGLVLEAIVVDDQNLVFSSGVLLTPVGDVQTPVFRLYFSNN